MFSYLEVESVKMKVEEIKALHPAIRLAGYLFRSARLSEIGARLRTKYPDDKDDWSEEEWNEWDAACDEIDPYFYALNQEEKEAVKAADLTLASLCRGEYPLYGKATWVPDPDKYPKEIKSFIKEVES